MKILETIKEEIISRIHKDNVHFLIQEMKKVGIEKLPYSFASLKPFVDEKTMNIHYNKHYIGYVDKLNKALKKTKSNDDLKQIISNISKYDDKIRNNAGGAFNHALFWNMLTPTKKDVPSELKTKKKINNTVNIDDLISGLTIMKIKGAPNIHKDNVTLNNDFLNRKILTLCMVDTLFNYSYFCLQLKACHDYITYLHLIIPPSSATLLSPPPTIPPDSRTSDVKKHHSEENNNGPISQ